MKKLFLLLIILSFAANAQFRRIALVEEATNASCGPCAANNPNLQEFVEHSFGGAVTVRYHAWWPGTDPMYSYNATENADRINYYGINGVPTYTMDGEVVGVPGNAQTIRNQMEEEIAQGSPIWINIERIPSSDSVKFTVKVIVGNNVTGNLKLRNAIIERRIVYTTPPGSNGEKIFNDVFRKMLPSTSGETLGNLTAGDTLTFSYSYPIDFSVWNANDLAVVSWVQNDNNKSVIQANIDMPTFFTKGDSPFAEIVQPNETIQKNFYVINQNPDTMHVQFVNNSFDIPSDWSATFELLDPNNTEEYSVIPPYDSLGFRLTINVGETSGTGKIVIFPQNIDDPYQYGFSSNNMEFSPNGNVLLIDADGGDPYETYFETALANANIEYSLLDRSAVSSLGDALLDYGWGAIYWNTAWGFPAFVPREITFLQSYLDQGGNLFIAGQDIGWDIFDASGTSNFQAAKDFYHNYLGANYVADNAGSTSLQGIAGDPITDGLSFNLSSIHALYPESISANGNGATVILKYSNRSFAAVKNQGRNYKTVYLGIGLEQVSTESARNALVANSYAWFGLTDVNNQNNSLPSKFTLKQNYPNPFNPTTTIEYSIPNVGTPIQNVQLKIYDVLGREIATLVNEKQSPGNYSVKFNANNLPSGIYFYTLKAGNFVATKKMILMK